MVVTIKKKAHKKMEAYCRNVKHGEIGGLLLGKVDDTGDVEVKNAILLKQLQTDSEFELTEEGMMEFTKNASSKMLKSVIGWWHYHQEFGTFWSGPDDSCFDRLCKLSDFCLGIVTSIPKDTKEMELRCRLDLTDYNGRRVSIDDIQPEIEEWSGILNFNFKQINKEIKEMVLPDDRVWKTCHKCDGRGLIEGKRHSDDLDVIQTEEDLYGNVPAPNSVPEPDDEDLVNYIYGGKYFSSKEKNN